MFRNSFPIKFIVSLLMTGLGIGWLIGLSVSPVVSIVITSVTGAAAAIVAAMSGMESQPDTSSDEKTKSQNFQAKIDPLPLALLVLGIVAGSIVGIIARNQNWFGGSDQSDLSSEISQWTAAGLSKDEVVRRLFENQYSYRGWHGTDLSAEVEKWTKAGITDPEVVARRLFESTYPLEYGSTSSSEKTNKTEEKDAGPDTSESTTETVLFAVGTTECDGLYGALKQSQEALIQELKDTESLKDLPIIVEDPQTLEKIVTEVLCP